MLVNAVDEVNLTVTWPVCWFCTSRLVAETAAAVPNAPGGVPVPTPALGRAAACVVGGAAVGVLLPARGHDGDGAARQSPVPRAGLVKDRREAGAS